MTVAMLDDFLIVCPREETDTDESVINRGRREGELFDKVLLELGLPKAVSKDQPAAFTTDWCGVRYFSKENMIGVPDKKWEKFRKFFKEAALTPEGKVVETITADTLRTTLGKFCHFTRIWPAGRPCLYPLWRLFFTARFRDTQTHYLADKKEELVVGPECNYALHRWNLLVSSPAKPYRRMIPCSTKVRMAWIVMLRFRSLNTANQSKIYVATADASWEVNEPMTWENKIDRIVFWLTLLREAVELIKEQVNEKEIDLILLRTNLHKIAGIVNRDLYIKSEEGMRIASEIHDLLAPTLDDCGIHCYSYQTPWELHCLFLQLDEREIAPWLSSTTGVSYG